jgi:hypothetical protein
VEIGFGSKIWGGLEGVGAQGTSLDLMGWVFGNTLVRVGRFLGAFSDLILARALGFAFGMIFGVGTELLKALFLVCLALPASRRRPLRTIWSAQMELSNGTSSLLGCFMTGRWRFWPRFTGAYMLVR